MAPMRLVLPLPLETDWPAELLRAGTGFRCEKWARWMRTTRSVRERGMWVNEVAKVRSVHQKHKRTGHGPADRQLCQAHRLPAVGSAQHALRQHLGHCHAL